MKVLIYTSVFVLIFFMADLVYVKSGLYDEDIQKCNAELIYTMDSAVKKNCILYFGESSNFTFSEHDSCTESIAGLVGKLNNKYSIGTISKGAIYSSTYKHLIYRIPENSKVKVIILTINLRSFGVNWQQSDLETNLSRANILYTNYMPIIKKFMLSFKMYDNQELFKRKNNIKNSYKYEKFKLASNRFDNVRDWDKEVFHSGILNENGEKDQAKTELACHFIKNYAFHLTENNSNIAKLDDIVLFCKKRNIKLIFNLLPENYENANSLCGKDLEILMRENVSFLKKRYSKSTYFIDNFDLLGNRYFIDKDWPTEHYHCSGREKVATRINNVLKAIYE